MSEKAERLLAAVERFETGGSNRSDALYVFGGRPGSSWFVHVPTPGASRSYQVIAGTDLAETITRALSGAAASRPSAPVPPPEDPFGGLI